MHIIQLLLQIAAIMLLCRLLGRLLRRIGQPLVIAEVMAGIALGPSVLGLVWPEGLAMLFPKDSLPGLGLVAQLGLVFFMFLVGLEFDPKLLQGQARTSIAISNAGILVPFVLGFMLGVPLHASLAPEGVSQLSFSLFLGTAMSVTAFPVLARILTEKRLIRTRVGAIALAAAAVDDVTAWCLLALVVGITSSGGAAGAAVTTGLALAYSAFVWFALRPVLARIGPRQGQALSSEVVAFVFLAVVLSAAATEWIGIHALFGAFLVGAAMPRTGGLPHVLAEKTEDFVGVVLLPIFFAYSGLRTQIGLLSTPTDWILCGIIVFVATLGKFGGTAIAGRVSGLGIKDSAVLGVLMNTRGLMELVVLNVGLDLGVISPRLFAMMVIMALVTTWITSPIVARLYPSPQAEVPPGVPVGPELRPGALVCLSDPATAPSLARVARAWAGDGVTSWALHCRPTDRPHDYLRDADGPAGVEPLDAFARGASEAGLRFEPLAFPSANPGEDIVRVAAMKGTPLVMLGVHRTTFGQENLGGVAGRVLKEAVPEVAVLLDHGVGPVRRVALGPVDGAHGAAAGRFVDRLVAAGATRVKADEPGVDLVVSGWSPGTQLPPEAGPSWLFIRAAKEA